MYHHRQTSPCFLLLPFLPCFFFFYSTLFFPLASALLFFYLIFYLSSVDFFFPFNSTKKLSPPPPFFFSFPSFLPPLLAKKINCNIVWFFTYSSTKSGVWKWAGWLVRWDKNHRRIKKSYACFFFFVFLFSSSIIRCLSHCIG